MTQTNSSISIIVPVYNGGESFKHCLSSLSPVLSSVHEVIVVADADTDGSSDVAKEWGAEVVRLARQRGPAYARNIGAKMATGDILLFVDADVTIYPDTIEKVRGALQSDPELVALIGSYDDAPGALNFLSQYKNLFHHYTHQTSCESASSFWGACGAIQRDIFLKMGGFDETYSRPCIEDIELGYRLKAAGYKLRLCKDIQIKHLKEWRPISLLKAEFLDRALPWTKLIWRDRALTNDLNLSWSNRLSVIISYLFLFAVFCAWWSNLALGIAGLAFFAFIGLNSPVWEFFRQKRGYFFSLNALPWLFLYYLYSGLAFAIGTISYALETRKKSKLSV